MSISRSTDQNGPQDDQQGRANRDPFEQAKAESVSIELRRPHRNMPNSFVHRFYQITDNPGTSVQPSWLADVVESSSLLPASAADQVGRCM